MFIIHSSNRTEQLAGCLASIISRQPPASLFSKELFLIQSRGMERMLSQYLAEQFGVWCNAKFLLPLQFVDYICKIGGMEVEEQAYSRDILTWQLEGILRDPEGAELQPLSAYLAGEQSDLKRFQLARQLADIFDQYQLMRLDILQAWESDRTAAGGESELWQKELWQRHRSLSPGVSHRGELIVDLINGLGRVDFTLSDFPRRIFVFGLHTVPPLFLSVLEKLSEKLDVHLFLLSPCELYWGDLESRKARARRLRFSKASLHEAAADDLLFHPLLVAYGTQGAHFQELLLEKIDNWQDGEASFVDPLAERGESPSLLLHLQADILAGSEPEKNALCSTCEDNSIQVVSCHSRMRELMVLRDHILSWMQEDQALEIHEIIVMAPDIQEYGLMIPAVFEDIQHSIADRNVREKNRYYDTFMQFLSLLSGRYGWTELVSILERPEVFPQFSLSAGDLETIRHWVINSGIRWGLSRQQRVKDKYMDSDAATWQAGLERMLMGYAIDRDETVADVLPFTAIEGGNGVLLGGLCRFVDLVDQSCFSFAVEKTLGQWSLELQSLCASLFAEPEHPDVLAVRRMISELEEKYAQYHDYNVSFQVVQAWLQSAVETGSRGGFLSGSLTFCSMLPMRSVPFRVICLLGLNDGEYPKQDYQPTFNLMTRNYRYGDRSNRADDRYQFLEAIIAARERLYLSYIGQSVRTNKKIEPSVVVSELLDCLHVYYGVADPTVQHSLHPYDRNYFSGDNGLFSYDEHCCRVAENLLNPSTGSNVPWLPTAPVEQSAKEYDFLDLVRFFSQPQVYFVRHILGINLNRDDVLPDDDELFKIDDLTRYTVEQELVSSMLKGDDCHQLLGRLQIESRWPIGVPGQVSFDDELGRLRSFVQRISEINPGAPLNDPCFELAVSQMVLKGTLPHCYENVQLLYRYAPLKGKDLLIGWLCHLVAARICSKKKATIIVSRDYTVLFAAEMGDDKDLELLAELFRSGCSRASSLLVEPAFSYVRQYCLNQGQGRKSPLDAARQIFSKCIDNDHVPEWSLLYRNLDEDVILNSEFEALCKGLLLPLWERADVLNGEYRS